MALLEQVVSALRALDDSDPRPLAARRADIEAALAQVRAQRSAAPEPPAVSPAPPPVPSAPPAESAKAAAHRIYTEALYPWRQPLVDMLAAFYRYDQRPRYHSLKGYYYLGRDLRRHDYRSAAAYLTRATIPKVPLKDLATVAPEALRHIEESIVRHRLLQVLLRRGQHVKTGRSDP